MKQYGANKATEFSKKQIGVIFGMAKRGELKVEKFVMSDLYNLADYYGYDDNKSVEQSEKYILSILNNVFDGNIIKAQEEINEYTERLYKSLSAKAQKSADRTFVG